VLFGFGVIRSLLFFVLYGSLVGGFVIGFAGILHVSGDFGGFCNLWEFWCFGGNFGNFRCLV